MTDTTGPAVAQFWRLIDAGEQPDVAELARQYPGEALALATAMREAAKRRNMLVHEQLWRARNSVLSQRDAALRLGELLRVRRVAHGLTLKTMATELATHGVQVGSQAIQKLEDGSLSPLAVKPPSVWRAYVETLGMDPTLLLTAMEQAMPQQGSVQHFTRMSREATEEDRATFIDEVGAQVSPDAAAYLAAVRVELGLPRPPAS